MCRWVFLSIQTGKTEEGCVLSQGASHWNAGLQPLLHAHVVQEDEALERQSEGSARSTLCSADKRREVGKGLSLADTQTGR